MKYIFTASFFIICYFSHAQKISNDSLKMFCEKAIQETLSKQNDSIFYIKKDSSFPTVKNLYSNFKVLFVSSNEAINIFQKRKSKSGYLYSATITKLGTDTMDIDFDGGWSVKIKRVFKIYKKHIITKNVEFTASCGGTNGYLPSARLIFNTNTRSWNYYNQKELLALKTM